MLISTSQKEKERGGAACTMKIKQEGPTKFNGKNNSSVVLERRNGHDWAELKKGPELKPQRIDRA